MRRAGLRKRKCDVCPKGKTRGHRQLGFEPALRRRPPRKRKRKCDVCPQGQDSRALPVGIRTCAAAQAASRGKRAPGAFSNTARGSNPSDRNIKRNSHPADGKVSAMFARQDILAGTASWDSNLRCGAGRLANENASATFARKGKLAEKSAPKSALFWWHASWDSNPRPTD